MNSLTPQELIDSTRVVLDQRKVVSSVPVVRASELRGDMRSMFADELVLRLETFVLSERLVGDTKVCRMRVEWPATPWQHFKQAHQRSWWLGWLVRQLPVKRIVVNEAQEVTFERYATYPHSTIQHRDLGRPVIFESYRTTLL